MESRSSGGRCFNHLQEVVLRDSQQRLAQLRRIRQIDGYRTEPAVRQFQEHTLAHQRCQLRSVSCGILALHCCLQQLLPCLVGVTGKEQGRWHVATFGSHAVLDVNGILPCGTYQHDVSTEGCIGRITLAVYCTDDDGYTVGHTSQCCTELNSFVRDVIAHYGECLRITHHLIATIRATHIEESSIARLYGYCRHQFHIVEYRRCRVLTSTEFIVGILTAVRRIARTEVFALSNLHRTRVTFGIDIVCGIGPAEDSLCGTCGGNRFDFIAYGNIAAIDDHFSVSISESRNAFSLHYAAVNDNIGCFRGRIDTTFRNVNIATVDSDIDIDVLIRRSNDATSIAVGGKAPHSCSISTLTIYGNVG